MKKDQCRKCLALTSITRENISTTKKMTKTRYDVDEARNEHKAKYQKDLNA
jgi:hypothetical protein